MSTPSQRPLDADARTTYSERLSKLKTMQTLLRRKDKLFGWAKVIFALLAVAAGIWLARQHPRELMWALLPALVFLVLWIAHERLLRLLQEATRLETFYRQSLARLDDRWAGEGDTGQRFLDPAHLYARDLDIFGRGSLYELLCQAASAPGQHALADWLLRPSSPEEITARQIGIQELVPRLDLREQLAVAARATLSEGTPESLIAWAESREASVPGWLLYAAIPLAALWFAGLLYWAIAGVFTWFALISIINAALTTRFIAGVKRAAVEVMQIAPLLGPLHRVLAVYEAQTFDAPRLLALTTALSSNGRTPSHSIARLQRSLDWLESSDNWFVKLVNRFIFWTPLCMLAIEAWRRRHGSRMRAWLASIGDFEALSSLANFTYEHPSCRFPTLHATAPLLDARGLTHPLLPQANAVANDVRLDRAQALIIVSGPNMAGKSTLLRAIGLNVVLAQCGAPVCCASLSLSSLAVGASITVQDSLQSGLSRFYAEIQRLKQITDLAGGPQATLFLLDELLSGTNSHDRRVGTEALILGLLARNAVGLITTHDLALTEIVASLDGRATNMHFGDRFSSGELHFDYRLTSGIANSTNALALMRSIGLKV